MKTEAFDLVSPDPQVCGNFIQIIYPYKIIRQDVLLGLILIMHFF